MNAAVLGLIVILAVKTDCVLPSRSDVLQDETEHGIFLRKLHTTIRSDSEEPKSLTWSEILADILVNKIGLSKILPKENSTEVAENDATQENVFTKLCSLVLNVYKHFVYDKLFQRNEAGDVPATSTSKSEVTDKNIELREIETNTQDLNDFEVITINPEVEIIDPKYHGKLCIGCDTENVETNKVTIPKSDCPQGLVKDANSNCVDPKSLNYMISIPYQCPIGYRLTWLGYCQPKF